ncbi:flagellar biosynthesis protein FlgB [Henriciella sp.]|uniref:flagellar biosynthesis protein FlgB n=1 Tax=Henriciella sp. TaxID=1968823 RepID=UPI0026152FC2|nr:flagellar biosynthesis protein FlgB [Henriciella sp.]
MILAVISDLDIFRIYSAMARHSAESQRVSATNISRADQPGFKATEIESFQDYLTRTASTQPTEGMTEGFRMREVLGEAKPNGNTVNLEEQVFKASEAAGKHEMALRVYTKSLDLMRAALGRGV